MADAQKDLQIVFTTDTTQAEEGLSSFGAAMSNLTNIAAGLGIALVGEKILQVGEDSIKAASDFQSSMALIRTQALASKSEVDHMTQALLDLSSKVGTTPETLAEGLYHIESAGFRGAKALDMLKVAAEGAAIGHANLEDVTQALISEIASGIKGVDNMSQAMGVLNAIVGSGDMRMEQLATAMSTGILPSAQSFGLTIQDVGAALATLTDNAVPADEAATRLRMTFSLLAAPTKQATKEFESIGLTQLQLADDMRSGGLVKALQDLHDHLYAIQPATEAMVKGTKMSETQLQSYNDKIKNTKEQIRILQEEHVKSGVATDKHNLAIQRAQDQLSQYQAKVSGANQTVQTFAGGQLSASERADLLSRAFGGGRSSSAILTLLDQLDRVKDKYGEISKATGKLGDSWEQTQQTAAFQTQQFQANMQKLEIEAGTKFLPIYSDVLKLINQNTNAFLIMAGVISAILMPPILLFIATMAVKGVAALTSFWVEGYKTIAMFVAQGVGAVVNAAITAAAWVASAAQASAAWVANKLTTIASFVLTSASAVIEAGISALAWISSATQTAAAWVVTQVKMVAQFVLTSAGAVLEAGKSALAWIVAAHDSESGFVGSLIIIAAKFVWTSAQAVIHAGTVSAAWVAASTKSVLAWLASLPRIIGVFIITSASAIRESLISSAAWITSAAISTSTWIASLPKVIAQFILTSASAIKEAAIATSAWIVSAATTAAGWVAASAKTIVSFVAMGVAAVAQSAVAVGAFVLSIAQLIVLHTWIEIVKTSTVIWTGFQWLLNAALSANPIGLVIVAIAILAGGIIYAYTHSEAFRNFVNKLWDALKSFGEFIIKTISPAIKTIADAFDAVAKAAENAWNWMQKMAQSHGAKGVIIPGFAEGVTNFSGGMALVGERGPELVNLPGGSSVIPNSQTQQILNGKSGGATINITIQYPQLTSQQNVNQLIQDIKRALGREAELAKLGAL